MKNIKLLLVFFLTASCTNYLKFDYLYGKGKFEEAYLILKNSKDKSSDNFQVRKIQVILKLVSQGQKQYFPIIDEILLQTPNKKTEPWINITKAWVRFISAKNKEEYASILELIPQKSFQDIQIEHLRLTIYAQTLYELEYYQDLLKILKSESITKKNTDLMYIKGITQQKLNQFKNAISSFETVIKISDNNIIKSLSYFRLAEIYEQENNLDTASELYFKAWSLNPFNTELNFRIGRILHKENHEDLHYRFYRASLRLNENFALPWYYLNMQ